MRPTLGVFGSGAEGGDGMTKGVAGIATADGFFGGSSIASSFGDVTLTAWTCFSIVCGFTAGSFSDGLNLLLSRLRFHCRVFLDGLDLLLARLWLRREVFLYGGNLLLANLLLYWIFL